MIMALLPSRAWFRRWFRVLRYIFSQPRFDAQAVPAVLIVAPDPWLGRVRLALLAVEAIVVADLAFAGSDGDPLGAAFAVFMPIALWIAITVMPKRLVASFGETDVAVQEGGIRAPHWR